MVKHEKEEKLDLSTKRQIAVTEEVYEILREAKKKEKISMAKIVCNLVKEKFNQQKE